MSAGRRWGLTREGSQERRGARLAAGPSRRSVEQELRVRDVAVEALLEERPGALADVVPAVGLQPLVPRVVLRADRAGLRVREAREGRARAEEGCDPHVREAAVRSGARRVRVERAARDPAAQVPLELALHAGVHRRAVLALRVAGARALPRARPGRARGGTRARGGGRGA